MKKGMIVLSLCMGLICGLPRALEARPVRPVTYQDQAGRTVPMYQASHALIIGVSRYTGGWSNLPGVEQDVEAVQAALEDQGFTVEVVMNPPDKQALDDAFSGFIERYGNAPENRLLFYFAGHGKTLSTSYGSKMGYIVAADAPLASSDEPGFKKHALDMAMIDVYARRIQAKHALFLFDSCFSGSLFAISRGEPELISYKTANPVRQFVTSGSEDERVPDQSIFRQQFVAALQGEGDLNRDGFVTGGELGLFLEDKVVTYSNDGQHPQYGKIRDPNLDKGDFVFALPQGPAPTPVQGQFSLDDLTWQAYLEQMEQAYAQVSAFTQQEVAAAYKVTAWERFIEAFSQDNPFSERDEELRASARQQIAYWQDQPDATPTPVIPTQPPQPTPQEEDEWTDPVTGMEFIWIPGGCFQMGQTEAEKEYLIQEVGETDYEKYYTDELPRHEVCVEGFWMGKYEVTNAQYRRWKRDHDSKEYKGHSLDGDDQPVVYVSWEEAVIFTEWLTKQHSGSYTFRLPTEAEWEYAARAGTSTSRFWGDDPDDACNYANVADKTAQQEWEDWTIHDCTDGYAVTAPVGRFRPNQFGLYDMLGNVWEWCLDSYESSYDNAPSDGSARGSLGDEKAKVLRGGSWNYCPPLVRGAYRLRRYLGWDDLRGVRVVVSGARALP